VVIADIQLGRVLRTIQLVPVATGRSALDLSDHPADSADGRCSVGGPRLRSPRQERRDRVTGDSLSVPPRIVSIGDGDHGWMRRSGDRIDCDTNVCDDDTDCRAVATSTRYDGPSQSSRQAGMS
jgi:hypothetical protein